MFIFNQIKHFSTNTKIVLFVQWLTSIGYFSVIPFLVVYLVAHQNFSSEFATFQLSLFLIGQYGSTFLGGVMTDKISAQFTMKLGLALQITCYLLFLLSPNIDWVICILSTSIGISKGLFTPAAKALVAKLSRGGNRILLFSFRSTVNNIGVAIGSIIGGFFLGAGSNIFFLVAASSQLLALILLCKVGSLSLLESKPSTGECETVSIKDAFICISKKPVFWGISIIYAMFSFLYMQLESAFPLFASEQWGTVAVPALFISNAVVVILFQVFLNMWMNKWLSHWLTIGTGFLAFTIFFLTVGFASELWMFVVLIGLYTIGEITIDPTIDVVMSDNVNDCYLGTSYSMLGIAGLLGGVAGNTASGHFLNNTTGDPQNLWIVCGATAAASLVMIVCSLLLSTKNKSLVANQI